MNKKDKKFLDNKLLELLDNNIISNEQYNNAKNYFYNIPQDNKSVITIFLSIGTLLIALSIITLFAVNWNNISKPLKVIISFVPITITSVMLYFSMNKDDKKMKLYTSIFAPISILATNSLIAQVFHIQTEIYELIFISILMFLPIAFILRNYISIIVYGIGTIVYSYVALSSNISEFIILFNTFIIAIPLAIYNVINYIKNKNDGKNIAMWIINVCLITLLIVYLELIREDAFILYLYMMYLVTQFLFQKDNAINKLFSFLFIGFLVISCISPFMLSYVKDIKFGIDTLILAIFTGLFFYSSKSYKEPKENFICIFILLLQFSRLDEDILCILINILAGLYGIYKIIIGNKLNLYKQTRQGIALIVLLILFRFMSSNLNFMEKSIIFLITGIGFMLGANVMKKRLGGKENE